MKYRTPTIWAAVVILGALGLVYRDSQLKHARDRASAEEQKADSADTSDDNGDDGDTSSEKEVDSTEAGPTEPSAARFHTMPDGSPVPALPSSAPEKIKLGVALFRYKGAQGTSDSTRSRDSALMLAQEATELGKTDFVEAVKKGDRGSSENIGWIKQRVLERSVEHAVFGLEKGQLSSAPIDTPRGFWVVKRLR